MRHPNAIVTTLACALLSAACTSTDSTASFHGPARMYDGFDGYARAIKTDSAACQRWFDQGLQLLYGYNHDEAIRSFQQAAKEDPEAPMPWWGVSYAAGLHINNPAMGSEKTTLAVAAAREARQRIGAATPVEAALVRAVSERYVDPNPEDRKHLDQAYADAMEVAWKQHPNDPDVGALYAESLMCLQPWDLWTNDGQPKGRALEIVDVLERVMAMDEDHPGANHFYIHTVEASPNPDRAVPAADRLRSLVPGSGHLVHMPSHVYIRVGRYGDAADANERAIAADERYFETAPAPDFYSLYFLHNVHFLAYATMMEGRPSVALAAARKIESDIPPEFLRAYVELADAFMTTPLHVMIRFGRWEEILAEPEAPDWRLLSRAVRHYARGVAFAATGRTEEARAELANFDRVATTIPDDWAVLNNPVDNVLPIARAMLVGELAYREGRLDDAFESLRQAVELEDELVYDEPPGWMQPTRHALGALLLEAGRPDEAAVVFHADLAKHPDNGWALLGLEQAERQLGNAAVADDHRARRAAVWQRAEIEPEAACYCATGERG
ncbi:MAG: hypothetical protein WD226_06050 [Planctomycetota bacterium]